MSDPIALGLSRERGGDPGPRLGDLRMWLRLMWLQFEVVRGPVGVVWGRFGARCLPQSLRDRHIGDTVQQGRV